LVEDILMARSREIPTYQAPAPEINPDRTYAPLEAFAAPGRAMAQLGGAISRIGEDVQQIAVRRAHQYGLDHWAEALTQWQDTLQNSIDEARQSGNYKGLTQRLREQMDADLNQRIEGAPDGMVASLLRRRFAVLRQSVMARAATFEHGMEVQDAVARLSAGLDGMAKLAYRDPSLAEENLASGFAMIDEAARAGNLNPAQREKLRKSFANTLMGAALARGLETDPFNTAKAIEAGAYDQFLDIGTLDRLRSQIDRATGDAAASEALSGARSGVRGGVTSAGGALDFAAIRKIATEVGFEGEAADKMAAIALAESGGNPYAIGDRGRGGSYGLTQIHEPAHGPKAREALGNPKRALELAYEISKGGTDFRPWTMFNNGGYLRYMPKGGGSDADQGDPPALADIFARIDQRDDLSPTAKTRAKEQARIQYNALEADERQRARVREQAARLAALQAQDEIIADQFGGDEPKITAAQVAKDPRFERDPVARLRMIQLIESRAKGGRISAESSHAEALALIQRIRLPEGDPNKITSLDPIYDSLAAGRLQKGDFDFVRKEFDQIRTPGGEQFSRRRNKFISTIAPLIDRSNPLMGNIDWPGKQQLWAFEWALDEKIEEYRRAGKDPSDLLNPSSPDYFGKPESLAPYQKTMQESVRDRARFLTVAPPPPRSAPSSTSPPPPPATPPSPPPASGTPIATAPIPSAPTAPDEPIATAPIPPAPTAPGVEPRRPGESPADYLKRIGGGVQPPPPPPAPLR
jgi:hypothetical protein